MFGSIERFARGKLLKGRPVSLPEASRERPEPLRAFSGMAFGKRGCSNANSSVRCKWRDERNNWMAERLIRGGDFPKGLSALRRRASIVSPLKPPVSLDVFERATHVEQLKHHQSFYNETLPPARVSTRNRPEIKPRAAFGKPLSSGVQIDHASHGLSRPFFFFSRSLDLLSVYNHFEKKTVGESRRYDSLAKSAES